MSRPVSRRRRPMTGSDVIERIFQDKDSDDSDMELGDDDSGDEDVISYDEPTPTVKGDDKDVNDSHVIDAYDSQLDIDNDKFRVFGCATYVSTAGGYASVTKGLTSR